MHVIPVLGKPKQKDPKRQINQPETGIRRMVGEGEIKENSGGCEFKYDIFDIL
jgi:hypothetical protein